MTLFASCTEEVRIAKNYSMARLKEPTNDIHEILSNGSKIQEIQSAVFVSL